MTVPWDILNDIKVCRNLKKCRIDDYNVAKIRISMDNVSNVNSLSSNKYRNLVGLYIKTIKHISYIIKRYIQKKLNVK